MKKLLLTLGAIASVAAPVAAVVACSDNTKHGKVDSALTTEAQIARAAVIAAQWDKDMAAENAKAKDFEAQVAKDAKDAAAAIPNTIGALVEFDGVTYKDLDAFLKAWKTQVQKFIDGSQQCKRYNVIKISYSLSKNGIIVNLLGADGSVVGSTKDKGAGRIVANSGISIFDFPTYTDNLLGVDGFARPIIAGTSMAQFTEDHKLVIEHLDKDGSK